MSMRNSPKMSRSGSTEGSAANLASGSHGPSALRNSSAAASVTSVKSSPKWKRVNVPEEFAKRSSSGKERLNLVVVGHVDAGKSTMMGHMLVLLGEVSERTIKKYERDAEKMKKGSFAFAWVLDETEDERTRGVTIDVAVSKFETPKHSYTLLDAPGHKDFIPNMISGASQADAAILVVDSNTGEFEAGFDHGGQTREHAILVRSLGVAQLIVAVNKLDAVDWSQERFSEIREKILPFLTQVGFKKQRVTFVPCSGFMGENLKTSSVAALKAWYSGPTLVEALDAFEAPARPIDKPLRMSIQDIFKGGIGAGGGDVTVSGRLEAGCLQLGDPILAMPVHETGQVRAIEIGEESVTWAAAGDRVTISIAGLDVQQLGTGDVLCDPMRAVPVTTHFKAQIVTFDIAIPLTIGVPVVVHHLGRSEAGHISRLEAVLNKATGEVTKRNPRALTKSMTAIVEIRTSRALCIELFKDSKELGRFMLRSGSTTVAAGIVVDVLSYERGGVSAAASTTLSTTAASS
ncbi:P-loop containing nucleoside triphosphate hydrolase protein [Entophlyctis helioformis]|nr:P-loop containing nucleoside triphosphate hydrolase protein [Entophlyctis helioformis]